MQWNWPPEHCEALRQYCAKGMSFSEAAAAINAEFKTAYSRNAAIGRAKRMGLASPGRRSDEPKHLSEQRSKRGTKSPLSAEAPRLRKLPERYAAVYMRPMPIFEVTETAKLRCVEVDPRHLSLADLEPGDCRYPYGGDVDGEAITFCGHPQRLGSSYCAPHFHLTRGPGTISERAAGTVSLRLVETELAACVARWTT
jgi:GcrA cell cycle regulator